MALLPQPPLTIVLVVSLVMNVLATLLALGWRHGRTRLLKQATTIRRWPLVTILKPLRGVDEQLEANLQSFAKLDYPALQIICCSRDPKDPALEVARRVARQYPQSHIEIVAGAAGASANPKVLLLEWMLPLAKGQFIYISDSNVCIGADDMHRLVQEAADPDVGLVYQPVVGQGEASPGAALENFHLSQMAGTIMVLAKRIASVDAVMGKGILVRREALADIGDFVALRDVLAEDYLMGVEMNRAGWKCQLSHVPARAIHEHWSIKNMLSRHVRHASMRCRLQPLAYPLELLSNPIVISLVPSIYLGTWGVALFAATVLVKVALELASLYAIRGNWPRLRDVPLLFAKDLLMFGVWLVGPFRSEVNWRGTRYRLAMGTRLIALDEPAPALRPVFAEQTLRPELETDDRRRRAA